jgi:hypothetical protein
MRDNTKFTRFESNDRSLKSICRNCFAVIGSSETETKLSEVEDQHTCDPDVYYNSEQRFTF